MRIFVVYTMTYKIKHACLFTTVTNKVILYIINLKDIFGNSPYSSIQNSIMINIFTLTYNRSLTF